MLRVSLLCNPFTFLAIKMKIAADYQFGIGGHHGRTLASLIISSSFTKQETLVS